MTIAVGGVCVALGVCVWCSKLSVTGAEGATTAVLLLISVFLEQPFFWGEVAFSSSCPSCCLSVCLFVLCAMSVCFCRVSATLSHC